MSKDLDEDVGVSPHRFSEEEKARLIADAKSAGIDIWNIPPVPPMQNAILNATYVPGKRRFTVRSDTTAQEIKDFIQGRSNGNN